MQGVSNGSIELSAQELSPEWKPLDTCMTIPDLFPLRIGVIGHALVCSRCLEPSGQGYRGYWLPMRVPGALDVSEWSFIIGDTTLLGLRYGHVWSGRRQFNLMQGPSRLQKNTTSCTGLRMGQSDVKFLGMSRLGDLLPLAIIGRLEPGGSEMSVGTWRQCSSLILNHL